MRFIFTGSLLLIHLSHQKPTALSPSLYKKHQHPTLSKKADKKFHENLPNRKERQYDFSKPMIKQPMTSKPKSKSLRPNQPAVKKAKLKTMSPVRQGAPTSRTRMTATLFSAKWVTDGSIYSVVILITHSIPDLHICVICWPWAIAEQPISSLNNCEGSLLVQDV